MPKTGEAARIRVRGRRARADEDMEGEGGGESKDHHLYRGEVGGGYGGERMDHLERDSLSSSMGGSDEDGLGSGWFLDHVDLLPLGESKAAVAAGETGARVVSTDFYTFPCNMWLGESDSGGVSGPPIASLLPARSKPGRNRANKKKPPRRRKPHPHLRLVCFPACLPHPDKVLEGKRGSVKPHLGHGGEDAYFIEQVRIGQ